MLKPKTSTGFAWCDVNANQLLQTLPFWQTSDIQRITNNLREQGILLIGAQTFQTGERFRFAINERDNSAITAPTSVNPQLKTGLSTPPLKPTPTTTAPASPSPVQRPQAIAKSWQPEKDLLAQLANTAFPRISPGAGRRIRHLLDRAQRASLQLGVTLSQARAAAVA